MCSPSPAPARLSLVTMSPSFLIDSTCARAGKNSNKKAQETQNKKARETPIKSPGKSNKKARETQIKKPGNSIKNKKQRENENYI
jgi:hypothetical protein